MPISIRTDDAAFNENLGHLVTPYPGKVKGLYLFGQSLAESVKDRSGKGADLAFTAGAGGVAYHPDHVDLGMGSFFQTPFPYVYRNMTMILIGVPGFYEEVYDGDDVYRWPPTVSAAARARLTTGRPLQFGDFFGTVGTQQSFRAENLAGGAGTLATPTYLVPAPPIAYKDGTWTNRPFAAILGQTTTNAYFYAQVGKGLHLMETGDVFTGAAPADATLQIKNTATEATSHQPIYAFAAYEYLTKPEALVAAQSLCAQVEARGQKGFSLFAEDAAV